MSDDFNDGLQQALDDAPKPDESGSQKPQRSSMDSMEDPDNGLTSEMLYGDKGKGKDTDKGGQQESQADKDAKNADDEPKPQAWDKDRQKRDQEQAEHRKRLEAQIEALTERNNELTQQMTSFLQQQVGSSQDNEPDEVQEMLDGLSGDSDAEDMANAIKTLAKRSGDTSAVEEMMERFLAKKLEPLQQELEELRTHNSKREDQETLGSILSEMDAEFGSQYRNQAIAQAQDFLRSQGRDDENPPTLLETQMAIRAAYQQLSQKGGKPAPRKPSVPLDSGRGGKGPSSKSLRGSLDDVVEGMVASGRI